jgi:hypothetical protein
VTNITGLYPRLKVDTTTSGAVGQDGGMLLTETIAASGLGRELSPPSAELAALLQVRDERRVHLLVDPVLRPVDEVADDDQDRRED